MRKPLGVTLKLLTVTKYGSLVAAPTFGLPEVIGGPRNWDYRYTWLRDSSFSLYALMRLGYTEEGHRFNLWLKDRLQFGRPEGAPAGHVRHRRPHGIA